MQAINDTLYDAFGQRQISTIYGQANQYRVILEAQPRYQHDPSALSKLYVTGDGSTGTTPTVGSTTGLDQHRHHVDAQRGDRRSQVPLAAFARFEHTVGAAGDRAPGAVPGRDPQLRPRARRLARATRSTAITARADARSACRPR